MPFLQADSIRCTLNFTKKPLFFLWPFLGLEIFNQNCIVQTPLGSPCLPLRVEHLLSVSTPVFLGSSSGQWDVACVRHRIPAQPRAWAGARGVGPAFGLISPRFGLGCVSLDVGGILGWHLLPCPCKCHGRALLSSRVC